MSVLTFTADQWANLSSMMKYHQNVWKEVVCHGRKFELALRAQQIKLKENSLEDIPSVHLILADWLIAQLEQCNRFAYAAQYKTDSGKAEKLVSVCDIPGTPCELSDLESLLSHIEYNLYDNCGNCYLPAEYFEMLQNVYKTTIAALKQEQPANN